MEKIIKGDHAISRGNTVLIQIVDRWNSFPTPALESTFKQIHKFDFADVSIDGKGGITDQQADDIAKILKDAIENDDDIVVHCHAGICRSGAVAEVASYLGFSVLNHPSERIPNTLVKSKLFKSLGYTWSFE